MAGHSGRDLVIAWDSTTLVGVRTKGVTITNDYVDVTTDDDSGWRTLLAQPGLRSVEVTVAGITSDEVLLAAIMAADTTGETLVATLPTTLATAGTLSAAFKVSGLTTNASYDGAIEFDCTFMSTGVVTYTASSA